jgi:recombinational DNA repair protein RecT
VTGFAVARWKHDGGNQSASIRMDGVEVHKRAVRGQNAAIEPGGGLSAPEGKSPWASDYEAMFKKTLDRTLFTSGKVPLSNQMERVMATDSDGADVLGTIEVSSLQELAARQIAAMRERRQLTDGGPPGDVIESSSVMQNEEIPF